MNRRKQAIARLLGVGLGVFLIAGCSAGEAPVVFHDGDLPDVSRATEYGTIGQISADSSAVVVAVLDSKGEVERDAQGFFLVTMRVKEAIRGDVAPESTIVVRSELADPQAPGSPLLASDRTFLLFIAPLDFGDGVRHSEYVVTGYLAGYYVETKAGVFEAIDPERAELPSQVSIATLREQLSHTAN